MFVRGCLKSLSVSLLALTALTGCPEPVETGPTNQNPVARIFAPVEGLSSDHGEALNLSGSCIDPESAEEELLARWSSDIDGALVEGATDGQGNVSGIVEELSEGPHVITLTCIDPSAGEGTDIKNIVVEANEPPSVDIDEPDNGDDFTTDDSIEMEITVRDDVDSADELLVSVESDLDGVLADGLVPGSDGSLVTVISLLGGEHLVAVTAVDSEGGIGTATVALSVTSDHVAPECEIVEPLGSTGVQEGESVFFLGQVNDPDVTPEELTVHFESDVDGSIAVLTPDTDGRVETFYEGLSVGDHVVTMRVVDEENFECLDSTEVRVCEVNDPPVVTPGEPTEGGGPSLEGAYLAGAEVTFSATIADDVTALGDVVVTWESDIDGIFNSDAADALGNVFFNYAGLTAGDHAISITADDGCGNQTTHAVAIRIVHDDDLDGFVAEPLGLDCDDTAAAINPDATEIPYDGIDQDCTGADLTDVDGDGHDSDVVGGDDCDDTNIEINPSAEDIPYDGIDQDCSGDDAIDVDGDGFDGNTVDCNDSNPAINPAATEIPYDNIDQDCDGADQTDVDGDGVSSIVIDGGTDCDDSDPSIFPGAPEVPYDGIDQDCNGQDLVDADGDGFDAVAAGGTDCNDSNPAVFPGAPEVPYDSIDQDCSGSDWEDVDNDGFAGLAAGGGDCADSDPTIYPGATDIPYDGIDQDCAGGDLVDVDGDGYASDVVTGGTDCDDNAVLTNPGAADIPYNGVDEDCDGVDLTDVDNDGFISDTVGGLDCNDFLPTVYPGAPEVPGDGLDNDCNGLIDDVTVTSVPALAGNPYLCTPIPMSAAGSYAPPGPPMTYEWFIAAKPAISVVTDADNLTDATTIVASFNPDMVGQFLIGLTVTQGIETDTAYLVIEVENDPSNGAPVADAGPDQAVTGSVSAFYSNYTWNCPSCSVNATLDATGSTDPDGNPVEYAWQALSGVTYTDATEPDTAASFSVGAPPYNGSTNQSFDVTVQVTDCELVSHTDEVTIDVTCSCN